MKAEIAGIMKKLVSSITTITVIGNGTSAVIINEIGDISKFDSLRKLVDFFSLDATVTQTGEFGAAHNVISKRGTPYLRNTL